MRGESFLSRAMAGHRAGVELLFLVCHSSIMVWLCGPVSPLAGSQLSFHCTRRRGSGGGPCWSFCVRQGGHTQMFILSSMELNTSQYHREVCPSTQYHLYNFNTASILFNTTQYDIKSCIELY